MPESRAREYEPVPGFYLREWRRAKGLTLEQVAERVEAHKTGVGNYETGKREPGPAMIIRLAKAIGIAPGELFRNPDDPSLDGLVADLPEEAKAHIQKTVAALAETYRR